GLHKNLRIQLPPTEHSSHVEDIVASGTAIARIFLYLEQWEPSSLAVGSSSGSGNFIAGTYSYFGYGVSTFKNLCSIFDIKHQYIEIDDHDITMEEYVHYETKKALRNGQVYD
nr:hypothetical protein [Tanacetum cinerariifolium]